MFAVGRKNCACGHPKLFSLLVYHKDPILDGEHEVVCKDLATKEPVRFLIFHSLIKL